MHRAVLRLVPVASLALISVAPPVRSLPIGPDLIVWIQAWSGREATICAEGEVNDGTTSGVWTFSITGVSTDGSQTVDYPVVHIGSTFPTACVAVTIGGPPATWTFASIDFVGAGTSDVIGSAGLLYEWNPATGGHQSGYQTPD